MTLWNVDICLTKNGLVFSRSIAHTQTLIIGKIVTIIIVIIIIIITIFAYTDTSASIQCSYDTWDSKTCFFLFILILVLRLLLEFHYNVVSSYHIVRYLFLYSLSSHSNANFYDDNIFLSLVLDIFPFLLRGFTERKRQHD